MRLVANPLPALIFTAFQSLSTKQARNGLFNMGHAYTEDSVRKAEVRMLVEAEFCAKVRTSPTNYLEGYFKELRKHLFEEATERRCVLVSRKTNLAFNERETWNLGLLFLDCAFLKIDELFREVLRILHDADASLIPNVA